ncbi:MAG: OmpA family protein [Geminicoccaceae bacterium]
MESFLSLPRSAKTGLAVLLAVALLGWGIVAYSSKSQHEDAGSLQQALATIDTKNQTEQAVKTELEDLNTRLAAAETDLSTTMKDKMALEDQVGQLETDLGVREAAVADLEERLASIKTESGASGTTTQAQALGLIGGQGADVDAATLRDRLTKARTSLSARSATLAQRDRQLAQTKVDLDAAKADIETIQSDLVEQGVLRERLSATMTKLSGRTATLDQRDRELEKTKADLDTADATIETLQSDLVEQGVLRERLSATMTKLSGRTATLAQRDRELERLKADYDTATARIAELEADLVEQGSLRERLNATMTKLSGRSAMLDQRDRALAAINEEHEALLAKLANFEADRTKREETDQTISSLKLRVDRAEQALAKGTEALAVNQQEIADSEASVAELKAETETITQAISEKEQLIAERGQELAALDGKISAEEETLANLASAVGEREGEIEDAKGRLADLKVAEAETEGSISSLTAELGQQEADLSNREDAVVYADARLTKLRDEVAMAEERIAEVERLLGQKLDELDDRQLEVKAVEATLLTLKQDRAATAAETVNLQNTVSDQEAVLRDLEMAKDDLEKTKVELGYQRKLLSERQEQIQMAEDRLTQLQKVARKGSQTLPRVPIAAISSDNLAVLPVDPTYQPFPVQTPMGIRLTEVHFDMGSADLTPGGLRKATEAAAWIKEQDVQQVRLLGFTDSIGTRANNRSLAKRRAESLLNLFEEQGVDPSKIEIIARGEVGAREVTEDQTAEPLNRCVGVFIGAEG